MPADVLTLGGIAFDNFSTPERMMGGGKQAIKVHKLPGGARVIDTLGPDEADITWQGFFYGSNAYNTALTLDAMRQAGQAVPLMWGGQFKNVVISDFTYHVKRLPFWVEYDVTCVVATNPALGPLGGFASTIDSLVSSDLGSALNQ